MTMAKGAQPLGAVLRLDRPFDGDLRRVFDEPINHITVKEVLPTWEEAEQEVQRLNALNADKGCVYFASLARYFPEGRLGSSET
jgi:hypothetical protein